MGPEKLYKLLLSIFWATAIIIFRFCTHDTIPGRVRVPIKVSKNFRDANIYWQVPLDTEGYLEGARDRLLSFLEQQGTYGI